MTDKHWCSLWISSVQHQYIAEDKKHIELWMIGVANPPTRALLLWSEEREGKKVRYQLFTTMSSPNWALPLKSYPKIVYTSNSTGLVEFSHNVKIFQKYWAITIVPQPSYNIFKLCHTAVHCGVSIVSQQSLEISTASSMHGLPLPQTPCPKSRSKNTCVAHVYYTLCGTHVTTTAICML